MPKKETANKISVFLSYSHKDEMMKEELGKHLSALKRAGIIETWDDRAISPGIDWSKEIDEKIKTADIILALVSSDFLASDYCYEIEMSIALERHKRGEALVIPVILRPVEWTQTPLANHAALPKDGKPISAGDNADSGYMNVVTGIMRAVENLLEQKKNNISETSRYQNHNKIIHNLQNHSRNLNFTGRDGYFTEIQKTLHEDGTTAITQPATIHGLGGIGKTQLALEYAWRNCSQYDVVWWLRSETAATLDDDLKSLGIALDLPLKEINDRRVIIPETIHRLATGTERKLLIFDNVESREAIIEYMPHHAPGTKSAHIIITSRSHIWSGIAKPLKLELMTEDEAVEFLAKNKQGTNETESAKTLARELGYLPLALSQARAYIEKTSCSLARYLELFNEHKTEILKDSNTADEYGKTVHTTWNISFDEVKKISPAAECLMNICSFLAPDDIPLDIFTKYADNLPEPLCAAAKNSRELEKAIAALLSYSLIERKADKTITIHRLVQEILRNCLGNEITEWATRATTLMCHAFNYTDENIETWAEAKHIAPHAIAAAQNALHAGVSSKESGYLFNQTSLYFKNFADFQQAKSLAKKAIKTTETAFGKNHPELANALNTLGAALQSLGDLHGARDNFEKALKIDATANDLSFPNAAIHLNNFGGVLKELGDLHGAKEAFEKALQLDYAANEVNLPYVSIHLNNLGLVLKGLGDLTGAKNNFEEALKITIDTYGEKHPDVAIQCNNLGLVLKELGDLAGANENYERALKIAVDTYGNNHPAVATPLNNVGGVRLALGDFEGAKEYCEKALRILCEYFGENHHNTKLVRMNLDKVLKEIDSRSKK